MKTTIAKNKTLILFDLDGTLNVSKMPIDREIGTLLGKLLEQKEVAILSGGDFSRFRDEVICRINTSEDNFKKLFLFPTNATQLYRFEDGAWKQVYAKMLSKEEVTQIMAAFKKAYEETGYKDPDKTYGEVMENRGSQITFSALGQQAPVDEKKKARALWDKTIDPRVALVESLKKSLPDMIVQITGITSIDVTKEGADKGYAIKQMGKELGIDKHNMLFIGDALRKGGNDYPMTEEGVDTIAVTNHEETKNIIKSILRG